VSLGEEKSPLTTKDFLTFLGMSIPALLAAKFVSVVLIDGIARGIYNRDLEDSTYLFITQFISCAVAAFVFVWVGSLPLKRLRWFSVWFFAGIAIAAALALSNVNSAQDFLGQCLGAVTSAVIFKNSKER
jgi:xanthine/uracil permease